MNKLDKKIIIALHGIALSIVGKAPKRKIPSGHDVLSPAHGKIIAIKIVSDPKILFEKKGTENHVLVPEITFPATIIVIEMTPLDVHVQRAPITGQILRMDHYHGRHKNAMGKDMMEIATENEKMITLFQNQHETIGVVQVAGVAARRIRNVVEVGDEVVRGDIYGRILFGSQVVVIIPGHRKILATVGDRVVDGETLLAK